MRQFLAAVFLSFAVMMTLPAAGAASASPDSALKALAAAIRNKDVEAFKNVVDVGSLFDASFARGYEEGDEKAGFVPFRQQEINNFLEGIASGEYALTCAESTRTGCAWYPDGLDKARITKPDSVSALVSIDNKKDIRSWLVLHRINGQWKVIASPGRLQHAELYATKEFRDKMARYRETVKKQFEREAEEEAAYEKGVAEAAKKAKKILETAVVISAPAFSLGTGINENYLTITMTVTNKYPELLRLTSIKMDFLNEFGKLVETREYVSTSAYIDPGKSVQYKVSTTMGDEPSLDMARKLVKGVYKARVHCRGLMIGKRNLLIDETGGGLKPRR